MNRASLTPAVTQTSVVCDAQGRQVGTFTYTASTPEIKLGIIFFAVGTGHDSANATAVINSVEATGCTITQITKQGTPSAASGYSGALAFYVGLIKSASSTASVTASYTISCGATVRGYSVIKIL